MDLFWVISPCVTGWPNTGIYSHFEHLPSESYSHDHHILDTYQLKPTDTVITYNHMPSKPIDNSSHIVTYHLKPTHTLITYSHCHHILATYYLTPNPTVIIYLPHTIYTHSHCHHILATYYLNPLPLSSYTCNILSTPTPTVIYLLLHTIFTIYQVNFHHAWSITCIVCATHVWDNLCIKPIFLYYMFYMFTGKIDHTQYRFHVLPVLIKFKSKCRRFMHDW